MCVDQAPLCRWGTEIDAHPDEADVTALLTTFVPRATAVWDVKRRLTQQATTNAERTEQLAALDAPEEPSASELREMAQELQRVGEDATLLRSIALVGCSVVLLTCARPWSACQPGAVRSCSLRLCVCVSVGVEQARPPGGLDE